MNTTPDISALLPDDSALRARRELLVDALEGRRQRLRRRVPAPRLLIAVALLLVLSTGAAVAAHVFSADDAAVEAGIGCYDRAALDADVTIAPPAADPVAVCAKLWRAGSVGAGGHAVSPELVACTGEQQPVRVFPGASATLCRKLGLVPLPAGYGPVGAASARALAALAALGTSPAADSACPSPQALAAAARDRLAAVDRSVRVTVAGDGPCAGGYRVVGDRIVVAGVSEDTALANYVAARIESALGPIFAGADGGCRSPRQVADAAQRALAGADLGDVTVRVGGDGACAAPGLAIDPASRVVTIPTAGRAP